MYVTYDIFNEQTGTLSRYKTLNNAIKCANRLSRKMGIRFAIFKNVENPYSYEMPELVKWVFPKKK